MNTIATLRRPASKAARRSRCSAASSSGSITLAVRTDALVGLDHAAVQQLGQHDLAVEDARPLLVADAQRVAEARAW